MFDVPEENEALIVRENVSFTMPNKKKQDMYVSFTYFDVPSYKQLLKDTGKADQERDRLKAMIKLKDPETSNEEAMLSLLDDEFDEEEGECDFEMLKEAIVDIEGLRDGKGKELPYSEKVLTRIFNFKQPRIALIEKFKDIHSDEGRKRVKRKN